VELQWNSIKKCVSEHAVIDQKQLENVEYFSCLGTMITNDARCTCEIWDCDDKSSIQQEESSFHQEIGLTFNEEIVKCYILSIALYGAETWTLGKVDQK
jgi:hypothetical protein